MPYTEGWNVSIADEVIVLERERRHLFVLVEISVLGFVNWCSEGCFRDGFMLLLAARRVYLFNLGAKESV